ncbi:hypothetical protein SRHO_G00225240 [Serrasalmus rhombeus]
MSEVCGEFQLFSREKEAQRLALMHSYMHKGSSGAFISGSRLMFSLYVKSDCGLYRGNLTLPKIPESNMALSVLGVFLGLLLEVSAHGPSSVPRSSWRHEDVSLVEFSEPGVFNLLHTVAERTRCFGKFQRST